ncbi:hypothetical protein D3C81_1550110 [compost metagenome]
MVALLVIAHVVVLLAQAVAVVAVNQRCAEVVHRLGVATFVGQGEAQVVAGVKTQGGAHGQVFRVAAIHPAVALLAVEGHPVAQALAQRTAAVQAQLLTVIRAVAQAQLVVNLTGEGLLRDHVDHRAGRAFTIEH